jgi:cytoskeleton protein RodZ
LPSFGEKLKLEREKRKISLEQISSSTKIGTRMLQALEEDKFNQLPGGIFNKGFVRAYSRVVGLDEDQTVAEYLQASGDAPLVRNEPGGHEPASHEERARESQQNVRRLEAVSDSPARPLPWGLFAALLLVVALALSFWSHRQRERARLAVPPPFTTTAASSEAGGASSPMSNSAVNTAPTSSSTNVPPAGESAPASSPKTSPQSTAATAALPGEFTVVIQAREESWVSIVADGKTTASELLAAGSERTVRGRKEVIVKTGNAGGIIFRFNGKKLDTGGEYGEVKTVTFGPGGLLPSAPPPPSTP